ncbi:MAG: phosphomannomutase/phosphoglucomutase [Candidatus Nezhaarchaeota archaeon]|nr:phosphomannomutase/phosphoglucomutase [Candidatus Nezhaarchaeota archaeon]
MLPEHVFRAYDIRGVYGRDLTEELAERVGLAFGCYVGGGGRKVAVGMDVRLSSPALAKALARGLMRAGCRVVGVGLVPTPALYYAVVSRGLDGGVMVTASHNPPEWNGFKLCVRGARIVAEGMGMEDVKALAQSPLLDGLGERGEVVEEPILDDYLSCILSRVKVSRGLRVALDLSNGCCALTAPRAFQELGCEVEALNSQLDGRFPGHLPEPTEEALSQLRRVVVERKADFGVGYDGDGDRAVFVDDKGRVLLGDSVIAILAQHYLPRHPGSAVVLDVSSSLAAIEAVEKAGGRVVVSRVGHAYIMDAMVSTGALIGGERSSHLYFRDLWGIDDGLYASLKVAELLSELREPLSKLVDQLPRYYSRSQSYEFPDHAKFRAVADIASEVKSRGVRVVEVDGVKALLDEGWFLIRASNTQPLIKVTVEARTREGLERLFREAEALVKARAALGQ